MSEELEHTHWTVDKRVPIVALLGIATQTVVAIIWAVQFASTTDARLASLEDKVKDQGTVNERLTRLETMMANNTELLREIRAAQTVKHTVKD